MLQTLTDERRDLMQRVAELDRLIALEIAAVRQDVLPEVEDRLLEIPAVAERLELKASYVYALARRNAIPVVRVGKFVRVRESVLREIETGKRRIAA